MTLDSQMGEGSAFTIYWPIEDTAPAARPTPSRPLFDRHGLPLLIVDDQPEVASAMAAGLTSAGFEVAETTDPEAALETILEDPGAWGCLITDYDMPGLTGGDLVARLAQDAPEVPVVVVSALAKRITDARVGAAHAVLSKPVNAARLVETVRSALSAGDTETENANTTGG